MTRNEKLVTSNGFNIKFIKKQTSHLNQLAIKDEVNALKYIDEHDPKLCMMAVELQPYALNYIRISLDQHILKKQGWTHEKELLVCQTAISKSGLDLNAIHHPAIHYKDTYLSTGQFEFNGKNIIDGKRALGVHFSDEEIVSLCIDAINNNLYAIDYIKDLSLLVGKLSPNDIEDGLKLHQDSTVLKYKILKKMEESQQISEKINQSFDQHDKKSPKIKI